VAATQEEPSRLRAEIVTAHLRAPVRGYRRSVSTPLRIEVPNGIYHATARGNDKQPIYHDDIERLTFLRLLGKAARRHRWIVLAYCLMGNHYHLVFQTLFGVLSRGFDELNGGYARIVNLRQGRRDHLFGRRFSSDLIETDSHMLAAARYVVLNPVRAGLCERPEDWPWSSYRACAGLELGPPFLAVSELLGHFGTRPDRAQATYRRFVEEGRVSVAATVTRESRECAVVTCYEQGSLFERG
jgi:putative transposase